MSIRVGRFPLSLWSEPRRRVLEDMVARNDPWFVQFKAWAAAAGTTSERYSDGPTSSIVCYQMTGDEAFARKAIDLIWAKWNVLSRDKTKLGNKNYTRENLAFHVWAFDWLYAAFTPEQRMQYIDWLNWMGDLVLSNLLNPDGSLYSWGTRLGDSDETVGHYTGLAAIDCITGPDNARAFLQQSWKDGGGVLKPVGGLIATAADRSTMRNAVRHFCELATGGVWIEGNAYSIGTLRLLLTGVEMIRTATGLDLFPEAIALLPDICRAQIENLTPDALDSWQYGDDEHPHDLRLHGRAGLIALLAALTQKYHPDRVEGRWVQKLWKEWYPIPKAPWPLPRFMAFVDPNLPAEDWRPSAGRCFLARGVGVHSSRTGWGAEHSAFFMNSPETLDVDHGLTLPYLWGVWRGGEFVTQGPVEYGGTTYPPTGPRVRNSRLVAGLDRCREACGTAGHDGDPAGRHLYASEATGGLYMWHPYYQPPGVFCIEASGQALWLPGEAGSPDVLALYDRVDARHPDAAFRRERYQEGTRWDRAIDGMGSMVRVTLHMPTAPTTDGNRIAWVTPKGQPCVCTFFGQHQLAHTAVDEANLTPWYDYSASHPGERKWAVDTQVLPDAVEGAPVEWRTVLRVFVFGGAAQLEEIADPVNGTEGVVVRRVGMRPAVALFNADRGDPASVPQAPMATSMPYNPAVRPAIIAKGRRKRDWRLAFHAGMDGARLYLCGADVPEQDGLAVLDIGSGRHDLTISPAGVVVTDTGDTEMLQQTTDDTGSVVFSGVPLGTWTIAFAGNEVYEPWVQTVQVVDEHPVTLHPVIRKKVPNPPVTGTVQAQLVGENGLAIPGLPVTLAPVV